MCHETNVFLSFFWGFNAKKIGRLTTISLHRVSPCFRDGFLNENSQYMPTSAIMISGRVHYSCARFEQNVNVVEKTKINFIITGINSHNKRQTIRSLFLMFYMSRSNNNTIFFLKLFLRFQSFHKLNTK